MSFANASDVFDLFLAKLLTRSKLSAEEREAILHLPVRPRRIAAHTEIVQSGERAEQSCLVAEGLVSRFAQMEDGRRQLISLHIPGDFVDLHSLILPATAAPLVALAPTTVHLVPHSALNALIARYPAIGAALWRECMIDGDIVAQSLVSIGRRDARGRLGHLLCEMAVRSNQIGRYQNGTFPFSMTQEQLADVLGLTPVHVNRSLQSLRGEELVRVTRKEATILDWDRLSYTADFDPAYLQLPALPRAVPAFSSAAR